MNTTQWNVLLHLSGLAGLVFPLGNLLAPLTIWLLTRQNSLDIDNTGKAVLNFQISYTLYLLLATVLLILVVGFVLLPLVMVLWVVFTIVGAVKASDGVLFAHPGTIRFLQ